MHVTLLTILPVINANLGSHYKSRQLYPEFIRLCNNYTSMQELTSCSVK